MNMNMELMSLVSIGILLPVTAVLAAGLYSKQVGNAAIIGNREHVPEPEGIAGRARRAHLNLLENAVPFAIVVLACAVAHVSNTWTSSAAIMFVVLRLVHLASYLAGITVIRTLAYHLGTLAILTIVAQFVMA